MGFFLTFVDFILKKVIMLVWKKMRCRFVLIPNFLGAEMSWCRTVFFNGCRHVLVPNCLVSEVSTFSISLSYMLHVSIEPGHKCSKEVTVLQKRAENHHCDTKDLKELLTKMLTKSRRKRSKPGWKLRKENRKLCKICCFEKDWQRQKQEELWANAHLWYPRIYVQCV